MINAELNLNQDLFLNEGILKSPRDGFGEALLELGKNNESIVVLTADLKDSLKVDKFAQKFPERFMEVGIAEQNMAGIAAGLALSGKIPYMTSHAIFSPSRNWDQIRLSIAFNKANVKIVGSHAGLSNGPDGGMAESLEDIALMRVLPNMLILSPCDYEQAKLATIAAANHVGPVYLRLGKEVTHDITTHQTPFEIGKAYKYANGGDIVLISSGNILYEALVAGKDLKTKHKIDATVINCPTIKPLEEEMLLNELSGKKVIVIEEHQKIGGLGSALCELTAEKRLCSILRIGVPDTFGISGSYAELKDKFGLSSHNIVDQILRFIKE